MKIANRTVLVTGGSAGIGEALSSALLARGCKVFVTGRSNERLAEARRTHPKLVTIRCDVTSDGDLDLLLREMRGQAPDLSLLVNNAGVMRSWNVTDEPWSKALDEEIATNLVAPLKVTSRLLPILAAQPSAGIVNITSALAFAPIAAIPVYCATKAALRSFTKSLRFQLKGTPIQVFELLPSTVATAMSKDRFSTGMLTPERVIAALLSGVEHDKKEIRVGLATLLSVMTRLAPSLIEPSLLATATAKIPAALPQT